jgi:HAE1 family hydrophobic/amphiphilic exporter-1
VEGIAAQLFRDQALTVSFSLLASLAVSLTLIPMMAALIGTRGAADVAAAGATLPSPAAAPAGRMLRIGRAIFATGPVFVLRMIRSGITGMIRGVAFVFRPPTWLFDKIMAGLTAMYAPLLRWSLQQRAIVLGLAIAAFMGALALGRGLGVDLIPTFSQGEFSFNVELPEGTPLDATDRFMADIQTVIDGDARIASSSTISGGAGLSLASTGTEGENAARLQVRMDPDATRADEDAVIALLRDRLATSGIARFKFERPTFFTFRTPIEVEVYGDNLEDLQASASFLKSRIEDVPGLVDVKSSLEIGNPELQVTFSRDRLAQLGLDLFQVASTVRNKVQGEVATRFLEGDREIDILVRAVEVGAASIDDVKDMIVGQRAGVPIYLKSVADVEETAGPSEIRRIGQKRAIVISGNLAGRDMAAVAADVRRVIQSHLLPAGVVAGLSGQEEEMQRSLRSLIMAMALAIFLVYLVMASQFESFVHPFVVIFTVPLGAIGAILALSITGNSINVVAMIGAVMLAGIVVNNAIILIDTVNQRRQEGMRREEAIISAGLGRFRPVLMTSSTTIFGLLPMAIGLGEGSELRAPLAITVIGGLAVATILTLVVIPVVYTLFDRKVFAADRQTAPVPGGAGSAGAGTASERWSTSPAVRGGSLPLPAFAGSVDEGEIGPLPLRGDASRPDEVSR